MEEGSTCSVAEVHGTADRDEHARRIRKQIDMRVLGCGWNQFATRWSSNKDFKIGTVAHLRQLLGEILEYEMTARRMNELPEEAALPQQVRRDLGTLGTVDEDAAEVEKRYAQTHTHTYAQAHTRIHTSTGTHGRTRTDTHAYAHARARARAHAHALSTCACTRTRTRTRTHTRTPNRTVVLSHSV